MPNLNRIYSEYDWVANGYKGFTLSDITQMTVRQRSFWAAMVHWRTNNGG